MLSRDLADFLVEFSIVLHKRAMYPLGHPHLQESTERFVNRLEFLLASRDGLAIGVARHQLIVAGVATDPRNALLSDLARRLHRHRIATVRFERGLTLQEIDDLLGALAADPQNESGPFGLRPNVGASWPHIRIQPPELTRLFLQEDDDEDSSEAQTPGGALWLGLAHLALTAEGGSADDAEDPLLVARAIDAQPDQTAYDRVILDYLGQINDEMSGRQGAWEPRVRERVSQLVTSLKPETLRRVLEAGADHAERRRFALTAAEVLSVEAVIEVVEAAAATTGHTISHQLLRLLHKFAQHAEQGPEQSRPEAESTLRRNVAQLITEWDLEDPNPGSYTAVLDGMARRSPIEPMAAEDQLDCEPEAVLQMAIETDCDGPRVYAALDALLAEGRMTVAVDALRGAPTPCRAAEALWHYVATPARLRAELSLARPDFNTVESLAKRLGPLATEALLDILERADDRSARARTLQLLGEIGPSVASAAAARLANAPWYVQRNLLILLRTLREWPPGFSAVTYARHADLRIRREAYKLLLEFPGNRASAIVHGLEDASPEIVTLVLRAAVDACPPDALRAVERFTEDWRRPADLRAIAVRAVARHSGPQALGRLLQLSGARRNIFGWRLEPKSPVMLAAVSALARYWGGHPQVQSMLEVARDHEDPEIRLAAKMRYA
jgi:hypothetical protein